MTIERNPLYLLELEIKKNKNPDWDKYPFNIPIIRSLETLRFSSRVTFIIGENGSGKSTLIEAIAVAMGFNPEGGTKNFNFATHNSHSELSDYLKIVRSYKQPKDGFFLRAESFYNVATNIDELNRYGLKQLLPSYGGKSLHEQSHGESFLSLALNRFSGEGMYILDEPESALSPTRQMTFLALMDQLVKKRSQLIIATHSPILLAYPGAEIYQIENGELIATSYEKTEHYQITRAFLNNPDKMLKELMEPSEK